MLFSLSPPDRWVAQGSKWGGAAVVKPAVDGPQTESLGTDSRPRFDTLITPDPWAVIPIAFRKVSKVLSSALQICCDLAPCYPSSIISFMVLHTRHSRPCFCILAPAAPQPTHTPPASPPHALLIEIRLGL